VSTAGDDKTRSYVTQAREDQQRYVAELLRENEKLRSSVVALESDCRRASELHRAASDELDMLRSRFDDVAEENARYHDQYQHIETQSSNLANLYVASYQLHSTVDRDVVLQTILEIVINLIGSEEVVIYERNGDAFRLATSFGVDRSRFGTFVPGNGELGQSLAAGQIYTGDDDFSACVPLKVGEEIIGAILVFRLLEHKPALQAVDHELFDLLAVHAATALYCASLHSNWKAA
jgi:nitrate/nitrite-specific signal transduction histidine kinase